MVTVEQVAEYNRVNVDWVKFFSMIDTLGTTMNGQKDRFDKSDLIEMALSEYSNGMIRYLNNDGVDHDLINLSNHGNSTKQEMKFLSSAFYGIKVTQRKTKFKEKIEQLLPKSKVSLKLMNSQGENKHKELPKTYAEFLIVVDNNSVGVIEVEKLKSNLIFKGDGIEAKDVPCDWFTKIIEPKDIMSRKKLNDFNYKEEKIKFQQRFLAQFS
jgi:hypothetical protein